VSSSVIVALMHVLCSCFPILSPPIPLRFQQRIFTIQDQFSQFNRVSLRNILKIDGQLAPLLILHDIHNFLYRLTCPVRGRERKTYKPSPLTLTVILKGKGEMPVDWVIGGTAVRPRSEDVCVSIVCMDLVKVVVRFV
jgi:hypothetical protein